MHKAIWGQCIGLRGQAGILFHFVNSCAVFFKHWRNIMKQSRAAHESRLPSNHRRGFASIGRLTVAIFAMAALLITTAPPSGAGGVERQSVDVIRIADGGTEGSATLLRTNSGVHMRMITTVGGDMYDLPFNGPPGPSVGESWTVGDATTNWFVVFNHPENCTDGACGEDDVIAGIPPVCECFDGGPAGASVHYAAGHVANSGTWHSAGSLQEGDTSGMLFGLPLQDAMTAEVHIIARSHGPAANLVPGELGYALNSVDGGCETNTCGDAQAAIFNPPT